MAKKNTKLLGARLWLGASAGAMPITMTGAPKPVIPVCDQEGGADKIATGIDKVQGDYDDLPPKMKLVMVELRRMCKTEGIDMERTMHVRLARL